MLRKVKTYAPALLWVVIYLIVAKFIGDMTRDQIPLWYESLSKPRLNPPNFVFGIVWSILYIMIALTGWRLWQNRNLPKGRFHLILFAIQTFMNWAWSYIFFYYHQTGYAFAWIVVLIIIVDLLVCKTDRINRLLMSLYIPWLCFAAYLNGMIWYLNK